MGLLHTPITGKSYHQRGMPSRGMPALPRLPIPDGNSITTRLPPIRSMVDLPPGPSHLLDGGVENPNLFVVQSVVKTSIGAANEHHQHGQSILREGRCAESVARVSDELLTSFSSATSSDTVAPSAIDQCEHIKYGSPWCKVIAAFSHLSYLELYEILRTRDPNRPVYGSDIPRRSPRPLQGSANNPNSERKTKQQQKEAHSRSERQRREIHHDSFVYFDQLCCDAVFALAGFSADKKKPAGKFIINEAMILLPLAQTLLVEKQKSHIEKFQVENETSRTEFRHWYDRRPGLIYCPVRGLSCYCSVKVYTDNTPIMRVRHAFRSEGLLPRLPSPAPAPAPGLVAPPSSPTRRRRSDIENGEYEMVGSPCPSKKQRIQDNADVAGSLIVEVDVEDNSTVGDKPTAMGLPQRYRISALPSPSPSTGSWSNLSAGSSPAEQ